jgi:shikimate kinase/3-dehydroquinate synthase
VVAPLFLIGFMAAGKTSVGRAIAGATGRAFVDLDEVIGAAGTPVATLVARDEPAFRAQEAAALAKVIARDPGAVIATGGGAAAHGDNLARMRAAGCVVALGVDVEEAERRARGEPGTTRPLIGAARELAARRAPLYRRAHASVDTTGRALADVVADVIAVERAWLAAPHRDSTILALGARSYPVTVTDHLEPAAIRAGLSSQGAPSKIAVITDRTVAHHWGAALAPLAADEVVTIEPGEASKSFQTYQRICEQLIAAGLDRGSAIVALGGGVVGDLAGFVAATLYRGIPVVQVPTTIVAMTDAAIGGKTAVDVPAGKNLVGAFWQPRLVACALETLATLPERERRAGFGELWKYALLDGRDLWEHVVTCAGWAAGPAATPPPPELRTVIDRAIAYKAAIVSRDEHERSGHRALLNLGHTVGHAIEAATGMLHGEAVGLGLIAACRVSAAVCGLRRDLEAAVVAALRASGLPADLDPYLTDEILTRIQVDKKRIGANLRFIVIREVGACEPAEIAVPEVRRILRRESAA